MTTESNRRNSDKEHEQFTEDEQQMNSLNTQKGKISLATE